MAAKKKKKRKKKKEKNTSDSIISLIWRGLSFYKHCVFHSLFWYAVRDRPLAQDSEDVNSNLGFASNGLCDFRLGVSELFPIKDQIVNSKYIRFWETYSFVITVPLCYCRIKTALKWKWKWNFLSCPNLCDPMDYTIHGNSPGQNIGVGSLSLLQGIFPTQGLNSCLPPCRWILYSHR